jgi:hypothetical protein
VSKRPPGKGEGISGSVPALVALAVGVGLILLPEPATTATGTIIVGTVLGLGALQKGQGEG